MSVAAAMWLLTGCGDAPGAPAPSAAGLPAAGSPTLCAAADCGQQEAVEAEPTAPVAGVGETVRFRDSTARTVGTITLHKLHRVPADASSDGGRPTSGSLLIADIEVTIEEGVIMATPLTFEARAPDGTEYVSKFGVVADRLDRSKLAAGERVRGDVAFDVPEGEWLIDYEVFDAPLATFQVVG